jgi:hypothetical protein
MLTTIEPGQVAYHTLDGVRAYRHDGPAQIISQFIAVIDGPTIYQIASLEGSPATFWLKYRAVHDAVYSHDSGVTTCRVKPIVWVAPEKEITV